MEDLSPSPGPRGPGRYTSRRWPYGTEIAHSHRHSRPRWNGPLPMTLGRFDQSVSSRGANRVNFDVAAAYEAWPLSQGFGAGGALPEVGVAPPSSYGLRRNGLRRWAAKAGGGGGNRTRVRKRVIGGVYVRSQSFEIRRRRTPQARFHRSLGGNLLCRALRHGSGARPAVVVVTR